MSEVGTSENLYWDAYATATRQMPLLGFGHEKSGQPESQLSETDSRGIEKLPETAHYSYRQVATLLASLDGSAKDPLSRNKEQLLYQLKNHAIDVFSRVGYISLTAEFISRFNFKDRSGRTMLMELMLRSPKLAKLGVTSIHLGRV